MPELMVPYGRRVTRENRMALTRRRHSAPREAALYSR